MGDAHHCSGPPVSEMTYYNCVEWDIKLYYTYISLNVMFCCLYDRSLVAWPLSLWSLADMFVDIQLYKRRVHQ